MATSKSLRSLRTLAFKLRLNYERTAKRAFQYGRDMCGALHPHGPSFGSGANMCEGAQQGQWRSKDYAASSHR
jgi:hypothetical protein